MSRTLRIGNREIGKGQSPLIIAEVAQAHDGSLGMAHAYIDAVAEAGAEAVKFQTHIAEAESSPSEPWRVKFSMQDATRFDYWKRMEFTPEQWRGLKRHADERGLIFLSSPFSFEAVDLLTELEIPAWKVASGEVNNVPMLRRMARSGLPMLLSSGMSGLADLDRAAEIARGSAGGLAVFQCTTSYPCPPEKVGLNVLGELQARYRCPVGLSDHSGKVFAGLAAVTLGVSLIEVHVTFSRQMFGPDVRASLTFEELKELVAGSNEIHRMLASPLDKEASAAEMSELRRTFGKSVVLKQSLPAGTVLKEEHLALKKPGTGIPAERFDEVPGRRLARDLEAGAMLKESDIE